MINQLLPTISYGDAVSNSAINMMNILQSMGYSSKIYAENIDPRLKHIVEPANKCPKNMPVIYHLSTGSNLAYEIPSFRSEKIMVYHNITPPKFFKGYSGVAHSLCSEGQKQLEFLAEHMDYSLADSEYNKKELDEKGFKNTLVTPIIVNYSDYDIQPQQSIIHENEHEDIVNILFVGRIAPNKKQDDIIKSFYYYQRYINPKSRLFLIGSYNGMERYYHELEKLIEDLQLKNVYIKGHLPFNEILAYYSIADLFVCLSEHEGFCVPLLEAMYFKVPILAYNSSAIGETLGHGGLLIDEKNYKAIAELINLMIDNHELRLRLIENQVQRLKYFSRENTSEIFKSVISKILSQK
jgi:L-malate glycosyltransferase